MANRFYKIILCIVLILSLTSLSESFENNPNRDQGKWVPYSKENIESGKIKGGHDTITIEGMKLKEQVHRQTDSDGGTHFSEEFSNKALEWFRTGAHDEDTNKYLNIILNDPPIGPNGWGDFFQHFYNPDTNKGLKDTWTPSTQRAKDYSQTIRKMLCKPNAINNLSPTDRQKVYDMFGRTLHLLQDMAVPSHIKNDVHVFVKPYENYVNDRWNEIVNLKAFKEGVTVENYLGRNYSPYSVFEPDKFMVDLAKITQNYPHEEELYDWVPDGLGNIYPLLNQERLMKNIEDLIPEAIKYTGGFIDAIYKLMSEGDGGGTDCSNPPLVRSPGGDHPDDRFDVSDEYYWEEEFKLTEADLVDLYLRTAIKKGKIGVWYKKKFMETFITGRTQYKEALQEIKDAIEAEFQAWGRKLEERRNQAESDWKGAPDVALFANGFYNPSISLMLKLGEPVSFQDIDFNPQIVRDHPVLLVPTGGFYGLEKSASVKALVEEYVQKGGTLVAFGQQHGYDWELLPTPTNPETGERKPVAGHGYHQDQSCVFNSVYIDTYHPILSVFSTSTANVGVDGYFTSYQKNSTVLLRRTANGQPAMILYPFGQGQVIATTLYSDFAFTHSQANQTEVNLVQNIISWAKKPGPLAEIKPGETVSAPVTVKNNTDIEAASVKIIILDPGRKIVSEQSYGVSIPSAQTATITVPYTSTSGSVLGIYGIDYTLLDQGGKVVQPRAEADSGRFAVSNPPQTGAPDKPIWFSVSTSSQEVLFGAPFDYAFHVFNNTDEVRNLIIRSYLRHTGRRGEWPIVVQPKSSTTVSGADLFIDWMMFETMEAGLYDESGKKIGRYELSFKSFFPSAGISIQTDKALYIRGEEVRINASIKNNLNLRWESLVKISVRDGVNAEKLARTIPLALLPGQSLSETVLLPFSENLKTGAYTARVEVWFGERFVSSASKNFELGQSNIVVNPALPMAFFAGDNIIPFSITNSGKINVATGVLDIHLKDPDGGIVHSRGHPFNLAVGESKTLIFPLSIPSLKFGSYTLSYAQSDESRAVNFSLPVNVVIPNTVEMATTLEKSSYRVGETAGLTVELRNTGRFDFQNALMIVSVPGAAYADTTTINLNSGQFLSMSSAIPIPAAIAAGQHEGSVTLALPGGGSTTQRFSFGIPAGPLKVWYSGPESLSAGESISFTIKNGGGLNAESECQVIITGNTEIIYRHTFSDFIEPGALRTYTIPIPSQATEGHYILIADVLNKRTGEKKALWKNFSVSGIKAGLNIRTDKEVYFRGENITTLAQVVNQSYAMESAVLNLKIVDQCLRPVSYHFYTWDGASWVERGLLHYGSNLETQVIDLSDYLPDAQGEYKVRIRHIGSDRAEIDYISLMADGVLYAPSSARNLSDGNYDILMSVLWADRDRADVLNDELEIRWQGVPPAATTVLVMGAQEGMINFSCMEFVYWQAYIPVTQAANTAVDLSRVVSNLNNENPGRYTLEGTLLSRTGQVIAKEQYLFNVVRRIALRFSVDKPVYRPGEPVTISGEVINAGEQAVSDLPLGIYDDYGQLIFYRILNIPAGGQIPFTMTMNAHSFEGIHTFSVRITKLDISEIIFEREKYEVASPVITAAVDAPAVAGRSPFPLNVLVENKGKIPATVQMAVEGGNLSDTQSLFLQAGESKSFSYTAFITMDTTFTINLSGDTNQTINLPVRFGEGASIALDAREIYPEGRIAVPFTVTNTGQMEGNFQVKFEIIQEAAVISQQTRNFALSPGGSTTGILHYNLGQGEYQITAGSELFPVSAQASFSVRKENRVDMTISRGVQAEGLIPIAAQLVNQGYNDIEGRIQVSVINAQGTEVWGVHQGVYMPYSRHPAPYNFYFDINPAGILPESYFLKAGLVNNSGQLLAEAQVPLVISGPSFKITQLPPYQVFTPPQEGAFTFKVKNTGNQEGAFDFHLKAYDLIDLTRQEWLKAGEEMALDFGFPLPEDLEEKDYFADYELKNAGIQGLEGSRGQVKYRLAGINLMVRASLNKEYYSEGETAHLTMLVSAANAEPPALNFFARVNYPGYESQQAFALDGSQGLSFDIPLTKITGEKLFFGIYHESGRSIHLNSLYIYKAGEVITLMTDKQVYKPGETVGLKVSSAGPDVRGILTLNAPDYEDTFSFAVTAEKSFSLPAVMTAGTYYVSYRLSAAGGESYTGNHPFDVEGIQVKVKEANLDKGKYVPGDMINLRLTIESNRHLSATLKTWVVDPQKNHSSPETQGLTLTSSELSLATQALSLKTTRTGLHRIIYGIYDGDLLLCSGAEVFDVGEAIALGVSTDRTFYPSGREPVIAEASLYGTGPATLNFFLNGEPVASQEVLLSGFATYGHTIIPENTGLHTLKAVLTSAGLISAKETTFIYGSSLPDLMVWLLSDRNISNGAINFTATVINRGKSHSAPTTLTIYDGQITAEKILATLEVKDLAPGETQSFSFSLNMSGRAGVNDILAWIDPGKTVNEFNRANNQTKITFTAPDLTLATMLDKDEYSPGEAVIITGLITNLSPDTASVITLTTTVKDNADLPVFSNSTTISFLAALETTSVLLTWPTEPTLTEGTYTIVQTIQGKEISSNKSITIKAADKDFAIACELANKKIEKGETVQYDLTLTPIRGFMGEVHLFIKDCPAGFTASFTPNPVFLAENPGKATLKMIPTAQVSSGSYGLHVNAAGGGRSHEIALRLDLTDFNITATPGVQRINQLEGATYDLAINPLHGFDSLVTLTVRGVPQGMRASLSPSNLTHSGKATLALTTSKWLPPGSYTLSITAEGRNVRHTAMANLVVDKNPLIAPGVVTAPGPHNSPIIKAFRADGVPLNEFRAFEDRADVHIAAGDVDGDGIDEIIVGAGKEEGRSLKLVGVFKRDGTPIAFMEADQRGKYEVTVAAGDIDRDWVEEVAVGFYAHNPKEVDAKEEADKPGHRRGYGVVKVYKIIGQKFFDTGLALYPYDKEGYRGAPNIAIADIDGDGQPELITAPGPDPSAPARIKVFKIDTREGVGRWKIAQQMADLIVPLDWKKEDNRKIEVDWSKPRIFDGYGATLTTGDVDGDGKAEIIVGAGPDPRKSAQVVILYYRGGRYIAESFIAYEGSRFGVAIASGDINGDGLAEIIAGPGPDPQSKAVVRIFRRDGTLTGEFQAYPNRVRHGVRVAVGGLGEE